MDFDWVTVWRLINIALVVTAGGLVHWRLWSLRGFWKPDEKSFTIGTLLLLVALLVGSVENLMLGLGFGWRLPLTTLAALYLLNATAGRPIRSLQRE